MPSFAITTPKWGVGEHVPKTLLSHAFISNLSRNVRQLHGDYRAARGRLAALYDADQQQIRAPKLIYAVTGIDQESKTITIAGNHASDITAAVYNDELRINGSTGNDTLYTFVSVEDVEDTTEIVVQEALPSAVADGNVFIGAARVLAYHAYVKESTGAEHLLLASDYHILLWQAVDTTLITKFTCADPASVGAWSIVTHLNCVYATNDSDKVLKWDAATSIENDFEPLGGVNGIQVTDAPSYVQAARCVYSSQGYLWLGATTEDGTFCPRRVRYSDAGADTFDVTGSGDAKMIDLDDQCGFVTGFAGIQHYVVIASEHRMTRAWLTETDVPWYLASERVRAGCVAPRTLVNDREGRLYWLAEDMTIRELESGQPITTPQAAQTVKKLNTSIIHLACATYAEDIDRLLFALPTAQSDHNDLVIEYDPYNQSVVYHDIPVGAFGRYTRQSIYSWESLPYETWQEWGAAWLIWDANANTLGFPLILAADYIGQSYEFDQSDRDAGETMNRELVFEVGLLEPNKHLALFKRINQGLDFFFQRHAETSVAVYAKTDGCAQWIPLGSSNLVGDGTEATEVAVHIDADLRAKHFSLRIVADGYFEFIGAYVLDFTLDGYQ